MRFHNITTLLLSLFVLCSCTTQSDPTAAALAERLIPEHADNFIFEIIESDEEHFQIESQGRKIKIQGDAPLSLAVGLNYYLKNYCLTTISWFKDNPIEMPSALPKVEEPVRVGARTNERFFLNYCTFGYTMPWWEWSDWEHFIDWMALNGVTMPLAITGQEAVWQSVWTQLGMSDEQIRAYFTGPAHLPWHRMTNIDSWEGPLPQEWIDAQVILQQQIVSREREFGMRPVLPAFAGHVPQRIKELYPEAQITQVSKWGGFADEYRCFFLAPMDPLFQRVQKLFLEEQTRLFGTDHIYGADPFNEIDSPSWDPETLAAMSSSIYTSLTQVDPDAVWLQMGWLFYADPGHWTPENIEAFLRAVPQDKMILLDYYCEFIEIWKQTNSFYGQPYMWCYLGNFGGNTMITGNYEFIANSIEDAFENGGENLMGIGSTLEGFGVNQPMYEFILDKAWESPLSNEQWIDNLADRHQGFKDQTARDAWQRIFKDIYVQHSATGHAVLALAHPSLEGNWYWTTKPNTGYDPAQLWEIWQMLLLTPSDRDTYKFDVVNIGRQLLGDYFLYVRDRFTAAYKAKDLEQMQIQGAKMMAIMDDLDMILSAHNEFSLQDWIESARGWGQTQEQKSYYEDNARTLISVWGDSYHLTDYASRTLSGMVSTYYKERWKMFIDQVTAAAESGKEFDQKSFDKDIAEFEQRWRDSSFEIVYPQSVDAVEVANQIAVKYRSDFDTMKK